MTLFEFDMDENNSLASVEDIINSPFESRLAPFVLVYCHCYQRISSFLLFCISSTQPHFSWTLSLSTLFLSRKQAQPRIHQLSESSTANKCHLFSLWNLNKIHMPQFLFSFPRLPKRQRSHPHFFFYFIFFLSFCSSVSVFFV